MTVSPLDQSLGSGEVRGRFVRLAPTYKWYRDAQVLIAVGGVLAILVTFFCMWLLLN